MDTLTLGIESSCDETAAAVVAGGRRVLSNVVASQVDLHRRYGGVFPELASRRHLEAIVPVIGEALAEAGVRPSDLSLIAVTRGPGLVGSLLVGIAAAKALAFAWDLPLVGVHHVVGHIYANFLDREPPAWPAVCLVVSGGHTELLRIEGDGAAALLGRTRDDAAGEAFDKVARLLGLPYPGGPAIERRALEARGRGGAAAPAGGAAPAFPRAMLDDGHDFSFSGLKTAVAVHLERERAAGREPPVAEVAAAFQEAVVEVLVTKAVRAAREEGVPRLLLAGGVAANAALRDALAAAAAAEGIALHVPPPRYCTDNAAMIACAGHHAFRSGRVDGPDLDAAARLPLAGTRLAAAKGGDG